MENKKELGNVEDTEEIKDLKENSAGQVVYEPRYWIITLIAVLITAILVGGGLWWYMNGKIMNETTELKQKISDLENQILSDKIDQDDADIDVVEPEMNNDEDQAVSTSDWQIYSNPQLGFEFKYPSGYKIKEDNLPLERIEFTGPNDSLKIVNELVAEKPKFTLFFNPDGFGPFFPDIVYKYEQEGSVLVFSEKEINDPNDYMLEPNENDEGNGVWIQASANWKDSSERDNRFFIMFLYDGQDSGYNYQKDFEQIMSSFEFLE